MVFITHNTHKLVTIKQTRNDCSKSLINHHTHQPIENISLNR